MNNKKIKRLFRDYRDDGGLLSLKRWAREVSRLNGDAASHAAAWMSRKGVFR